MERGIKTVEPNDGLIRIAHRGLHQETGVVENSRNAVTRAFDADVDGIEVDLQLLGDGTLVLFHDSGLKLDNGTRHYLPLSTLDYSEFQSRVDFEPLSLSELMELDWMGKRVILECKPNRNHLSLVRRLQLVLDQCSPSGPVTLSSYDPAILFALSRRIAYPIAPVISDFSGHFPLLSHQNHWSELHLSLDLIDHPLTADLADEHDVIVWTVNERNYLGKLERLGIKGIMTDNLAVLERHR